MIRRRKQRRRVAHEEGGIRGNCERVEKKDTRCVAHEKWLENLKRQARARKVQGWDRAFVQQSAEPSGRTNRQKDNSPKTGNKIWNERAEATGQHSHPFSAEKLIVCETEAK